MPSRRPPPETCANCGADIPRNARSCPECGADERTGWRETSLYDGLDLPESAWEDDTAGSRRGPARARRQSLPWYWVAAGILVLLVFGLTVLGLW